MDSSQRPEFKPVRYAWGIALRSRTVIDTPRLIISAGLIGTSILAVFTLLTLPRLDGALKFSLDCFAVAISAFGWGYLIGSIKARIKGADPRASFLRLWLRHVSLTAWMLELPVGWIAVLLGFASIFAHFAGSALTTAIIAFFGVPALVLVIATAAMLTLDRDRVVRIRAAYRKKYMAPPPTSNEPPSTDEPQP